jgi:uncharacterized protein (UPF0335 family)
MLSEQDLSRLPEAIRIVVNDDRASTSYLQRKLAIGYNAAARLIEEMEARGVVSKPCEFGKRDVLWTGPIEATADAAPRSPSVTISADGTSVTTTVEDLKNIGRRMSAADRKRRKVPPLKNTPEDHAVDDQAYGVAADELRQFIEQFEQLEAEKKDIAERQKEVMAEAKARGYDTKVMKQIIALRRRDKDDIAEEEAILDMYKAALGMV